MTINTPVPLQYGVRPRGRMCYVCEKGRDYCRDLPFRRMPVIGVDSDGTRVVKCTQYIKK